MIQTMIVIVLFDPQDTVCIDFFKKGMKCSA